MKRRHRLNDPWDSTLDRWMRCQLGGCGKRSHYDAPGLEILLIFLVDVVRNEDLESRRLNPLFEWGGVESDLVALMRARATPSYLGSDDAALPI